MLHICFEPARMSSNELSPVHLQVPTRAEAAPLPVISCFQMPDKEAAYTQPGCRAAAGLDDFTDVDYGKDDMQD